MGWRRMLWWWHALPCQWRKVWLRCRALLQSLMILTPSLDLLASLSFGCLIHVTLKTYLTRLDLCWLHHHITIIAIKAIAITCCCSIVDGRKKITESDFLWFSLANFLTNRWTTRRKKVRFNKGQCEHRPDQNLIATMYHFFPLVRTVVRTFRCESDLKITVWCTLCNPLKMPWRPTSWESLGGVYMYIDRLINRLIDC